MNKPEVLSMDIPALTALLTGWGEPSYRARQLFTWLQKKGVTEFSAMSDLPISLQKRLYEETELSAPVIMRRLNTKKGDTVKLLLALADGELIETVLMLYERKNSRDRATCCISTQSGCAMGCAFCASALNKHPRNLSAGEMIAQAIAAVTIGQEYGFAGISNVVFMGMGEPLANMTHLKQAILLMNDAQGLNIGQRRITVSTCGLIPQIYELAQWGLQINLAVSLHAAAQEKRLRLMPIAARYTIAELLTACRYYRMKTGRRVTMEYALFSGVNDSEEDARQLANLLAGEDILVNIIPANNVIEAGFYSSERELIKKFHTTIVSRGIEVAVRERRGTDIDAACGQLRGGLSLSL
ncbi:MAG: 23S rRNA (adenine(2503)-C(2))-methyltransferase RlmN [Firmicutes bacterium]|nr:23S rRNA (adenine(2503)-C(2))-methyltransferase RlmN [Bacillota bacterium]